MKASKATNAEQLSSFQEEIMGKEELIQELQSIVKGTDKNVFFSNAECPILWNGLTEILKILF